ncbi:MAG TPA: extracellular solute-binding protein [Firmicutes bacterium]|nr:extracellular solute-binding protein [Bacillota bacterium]
MRRIGWHPNGNNWGLGWQYTFGGNCFDPVNWKPTFETPEILKALRWINEYYDVYGNARASRSRFLGQEASMVMDSSTIYFTAVNNPDLDFFIGRFPTAEGVPGFSMGWVHAVAMIKGAPHPEEAAKFLLFLIEPEVQMMYYTQTYIMPVNMTIIRQAAARTTDPRYRVLFDMLPIGRSDPPLTYLPGGLNTICSTIITKMANKELTPEAAMQEMQREATLPGGCVSGMEVVRVDLVCRRLPGYVETGHFVLVVMRLSGLCRF